MSSTPSDNRFPFLAPEVRQIDRVRRDPVDTSSVVSYESVAGNALLPWSGDDTAPYVHGFGRASSDGVLGITPVQDGDPQQILVDLYGKIYVLTTPAPGSIQMVEGDIANDSPDSATSNPVGIGGHAVANGGALATVDVDDRVRAAFSRNGALHTLTSPNPIADATTYAFTNAPSAAGNGSGQRVVKASAGRLRRAIFVNNDPSNTLYAQIHNTNAVGTIATGTIVWPGIPVPANGGAVGIDFDDADLCLSAGIALALSTTQGTYTAAAVTGFTAAQYA